MVKRFKNKDISSKKPPLVSDFEKFVGLYDQTTSRGFSIVGGTQNMKRQCDTRVEGTGDRKTWAGTEEKMMEMKA